MDAATFFHSYLKRHKQNVTINNTHKVFQNLLSGITEGSVLGLLLCKIFINGLYLYISKTYLLNFADENTISAAGNTTGKPISNLFQLQNKTVKLLLIGSK